MKQRILLVDDGDARSLVHLVREEAANVSEAGVLGSGPDESIEDQLSAIDRALDAKFGVDEDGWSKYRIVETFPAYVIARGRDGELYQIKYSADDSADGYSFEDPIQVETAYVPVTQSARFVVEADCGGDPLVFPVIAIEAGWGGGTINGSAAPHYFTPETVAQIAEAMNNTKFGRRHPLQGDGANEPDRIAGWFEGGRLDGNRAAANLHLLESETDLASKFNAARKAGKLGELFGLSINAWIGFKKGKVDGRDAMISGKLAKLSSVDLCAEAGAGGRFLVAASRATLSEISALQTQAVRQTHGNAEAGRDGGAMKKRILQVLEALRAKDANRAGALTTELEGLSEDKLADFLVKVTEAAMESATANNNQANVTLVAEANATLKMAQKLQAQNLIDQKLAASKLPTAAASLVKEHLAGVLESNPEKITAENIDAEIKRTREAFAAFSSVGRVHGGIEVGDTGADKLQAAMDATFGVKEAIAAGAKPFKFRGAPSLTAGYVAITGDHDLSFQGGLFLAKQAADNIQSTDFPNILLNSMTKRLIQDYAEVPSGGVEKLYSTTTVSDYKTQNRVRMGYLGDLVDVLEGGNYTEFTKPTDDLISYSVVKKGNILSITEETIRNDDLGKIAQFPGRMARAARRTLKQRVSNFFINNPAYNPDGLSWFNAGHNNLYALPLTPTNLTQVRGGLKLQTEKDSNKPLALPLQWLMIHPDLWGTAVAINQSESWPTGPGTFSANPWYHKFGVNDEGIIENELLQYANDWFFGCFPTECPCIEVGFLGGFETPQMYINNNPSNGSVPFSKDEIQYKVKHVYGYANIDFRGVGYSAQH
jgi:hypothetical protein